MEEPGSGSSQADVEGLKAVKSWWDPVCIILDPEVMSGAHPDLRRLLLRGGGSTISQSAYSSDLIV